MISTHQTICQEIEEDSVEQIEEEITFESEDSIVATKLINNLDDYIVRDYPIDPRGFDSLELAKYTQDPDFYYDRKIAPPPTDTFWDAIANYFNKLIDSLFEVQGADRAWYFLKLFLAIAIVLYALSRLTGMDLQALFFKSNQTQSIELEIFDENIHEMDFEQLIDEAISKGNYKLAIRLYYLKALKALEAKDIIKWEKDKTNADYRREVSKSNYSDSFAEITKLFDYVCYGEFQLDTGSFEMSKEKFKHFISSL